VNTPENTETDDDILGFVPEPNTNGGEYTLLEDDDYAGFLRDIKVVPKTLEQIARDTTREAEQAKKDGREPRTVDTHEHEWLFELTEEGYEGHTIRSWTSRSFHPRSTGYAYASVLYGRDLEPTERVKKSLLVNAPCRVKVGHYEKKDGTVRNKVEFLMKPKRAKAPAPKASASAAAATDDTLGLRARLEAAKAVKAEGWDLGAQKRVYANLAGKTPFQELSAGDQIKVVEAFEEAAGLTDIEF
jgi:hypothetical protein